MKILNHFLFGYGVVSSAHSANIIVNSRVYFVIISLCIYDETHVLDINNVREETERRIGISEGKLLQNVIINNIFFGNNVILYI